MGSHYTKIMVGASQTKLLLKCYFNWCIEREKVGTHRNNM